MFEVRPGITGWAQVNGRKDVEWNKRIKMNVWYVDNLSLWLDIKILFMTVFKVFSNADNENKGATVVSAPSDNVSEDNTQEESTQAEAVSQDNAQVTSTQEENAPTQTIVEEAAVTESLVEEREEKEEEAC